MDALVQLAHILSPTHVHVHVSRQCGVARFERKNTVLVVHLNSELYHANYRCEPRAHRAVKKLDHDSPLALRASCLRDLLLLLAGRSLRSDLLTDC